MDDHYVVPSVPRVLIVDDEPVVRDVLVRMAAAKGYETFVASDGNDALEKLAQTPIDVMVLDLCMPGLPGLEVLQQLQDRKRSVSTIIITGFAAVETLREAMWHGCCDYIAKPFDIDEVARAVERALDSRRVILEVKKREQEAFVNERLTRIAQSCASTVHDINAVLISTKHFLKTLQSSSARPQERIQLRMMQAELERAERMVLKTLHFNASQDPVFQKTNIHRIIVRAFRLLKYRMQSSHIGIKPVFCRHLPQVMCDPDMMEEVFLNIFTNSLDAMRDGGTIAVATSVEADMFVVEVSDTGSGIAPEVLLKLFRPFYTTKPNGTGLGLAIVRRIIFKHKGTVRLRSEAGGGAVVRFSFPVDQLVCKAGGN